MMYCYGFPQQRYISYSVEDGLASSRIYRMIQDAEGNMWFATNRGLSRFDGTRFTNFTYKNGLTNQDVWELAVDEKDNKIWFFSKSTHQGYIKNNKVFLFPNADKKGLSPNIFFHFKNDMILETGGKCYQLKNNKWQSTFDKNYSGAYHPFYKKKAVVTDKLVRFTDNNGNVSECNYDSSTSQAAFKYGVIDEHLLYMFSSEGIMLFDFKNNKCKFLSAKSLFGTKELDRATKFDKVNGKIHLATRGQMIVFNNDFSIAEHYNYQQDFPDNINSYLDRDGNFWHNNESGLVFESAEQRNAGYYLANERVLKLGIIDGEFYAGTYNGFYKWNDTSRNFKKVDFITGVAYKIKDRKLVSDKEIWESTNGKWDLISKHNNWKYIYGTYKDFVRYRDLQFVVVAHGIVKNDNSKNKVSEIQGSNIFSGIVFKNNLYFIGANGIYLYRNGKIIPVFGERFNYPVISYHNLGNVLLIGTEGLGMFYFDGVKLKSIPATRDLVVSSIIKDPNSDNAFFFGTEKGVKKLVLKGKSFNGSIVTNTYTKADGLRSDHINDMLIRDSVLYTATDFGISSIDLSNAKLYRKVPISFSKDTLIVQPEHRDNIAIPFFAKDFVKGKSSRFLYRILPESEEWKPIQEKTVHVGYLKPGNYTLEVKSITLHQAESESEITIIVLPKWWEKTWVIMLFVFIVVILIMLIIYVSYLNFKKKYKRKINAEKKLIGLELQSLRSQMNPHFIHNSLNSIQYYIQRNDVERSENYLTRFSRLIRMFFDYSSIQSITLQNETELLEHYLTIEKMRFEDKLDYEIICDETLKTENPQIPSMILQPVVENAVNHGILQKKNGGKITIAFKKMSPDLLEVRIDDDGIGYEKSRLLNLNQLKSGKRSSEVLAERIELLNQSGQKIEFEIIDKNALDKNQTGTIVSFRILINKEEKP